MSAAHAGAERGAHANGRVLIRWLGRALTLVGLVLAATGLLPLLPVDWWWVRIGDFPRLQLLVAYLILVATLTPFHRATSTRIALVLLGLGIGIQLYWIFPYLPIAPYEVEWAHTDDPDTRLRILSANVLQENETVAPLLEIIGVERPDVVVLCEVDDRWIADLEPLADQFSYRLTHPLDNTYGIALYTNLPVVTAEVRSIVEEHIPSLDARIRLSSGHVVRLFAVHPAPPRPGQDTTQRDAELVLVGREVARDPSAVVVGDLNDVGWSRTTNLFQEVSGLLDPRKGRGHYPTFNARSLIWRYPLDYLFHSDDFRVVELRTLGDIGSDHFPLLVELSHEPAARSTQEGPDLDAGDLEDARDAIQAIEPSTDETVR